AFDVSKEEGDRAAWEARAVHAGQLSASRREVSTDARAQPDVDSARCWKATVRILNEAEARAALTHLVRRAVWVDALRGQTLEPASHGRARRRHGRRRVILVVAEPVPRTRQQRRQGAADLASLQPDAAVLPRAEDETVVLAEGSDPEECVLRVRVAAPQVEVR